MALTVIPAQTTVIPAQTTVIPAQTTVIPAQAGIHVYWWWLPFLDPGLRRDDGSNVFIG